ncbi:MAG: BTAD domain-containing putative transcriptional regulator, partial [Ardenticatenaceae bacterium]
MPSAELILQTKLAPPRLHRRLLPRPLLLERLREALDVRLTVVQAGTGYGKTTALAALAAEAAVSFWYTVEEMDSDPQRFLSYLVEAFRYHLPSLAGSPWAILQERSSEGSAEVWRQALDALVNALTEALDEPSLLILDDFHFVAASPDIGALVERLITYAPPALHIALSTRHPVAYSGMARWRARGEVLEVDRSHLAFGPAEIETLFGDT